MDEEEIKNLLKQMISIGSVSGEEDELKAFLKQELEDMPVQLYEAYGNLVAKLDNGGDHALHFNAHMDTVSGEAWQEDLLDPVEEDGKIHGLGASDLKGGIAALIAALDSLKDRDLDADVFVELVTMEEVDGSGTQKALQFMETEGLLSGYEEQACVLTEPTSLATAEIGCKGCVFLEIEASGDSVHGSRPDEGVNAVLKMKEAIEQLEELGEEFNDHSNSELGSPSIAVGTTIESEGSVNSLPSSCVMTCDVRTTPDIHGDVMDMVKEKLPEGVEVSLHSDPTPPSYTEPDSNVVEAAVKASDAVIDTADGADDSPFYSEKGIDTVVLGPGEKDVIHGPGEYIQVEKLVKSVDVYVELAEKWAKSQSQL